jgi:hypothetical protein
MPEGANDEPCSTRPAVIGSEHPIKLTMADHQWRGYLMMVERG